MGRPYLARLARVSGTGPLVTMVLSPCWSACTWPAGACEGSTIVPLVFMPEAPALALKPLIGEALAALRAEPETRLARMSGSGGTCFAIFENAAEAQAAARKILLDHPGWWVHAGALS